jgi:hypothetical protein
MSARLTVINEAAAATADSVENIEGDVDSIEISQETQEGMDETLKEIVRQLKKINK